MNIAVAFQYCFGQYLIIAQWAQIRKEEKILSQEACAVAKVPTAAGIPLPDSGNRSSGDMLMKFIVQSLHDDKAEEVVSIDLNGKSEMADYMIVASGRSTRQVTSISERLIEKLKHDLKLAARVEGKEYGDWVLIDAGDVIVHVFRPEVRQFYQLEKMWMSSDGESATL